MRPHPRKVLVIGWDAADWKVIRPLMSSGKMPNLCRLVKGGVSGNIATTEPVLSPMLWTSIATGKRAHKHGILGFSEVDPASGRIRPVTTLGRRTKAIWNILSQEEKRCNVVGWWPSHPAEPIHGVMVSNHYHTAAKPLEEPWPLPEDCVHPARLREPLAELRLHPQELTHEHIGPFVPRWREVPEDAKRTLDSLAKTVAECTSVHSAATALMQLEPWDFMAVYYDAIDHFSHAFMKYHPPRNEWVPEREFELFKGVIEGAYRYHDLMLGTLLNLAGPETTVMLLSDHGFHSDKRRLRSVPREPAGPAAEHRQFGVFVAAGPGMRRGESVDGASLLDIAPTVLALFGLPGGEDMDGKVLATIFEEPPRVDRIPSWDAVKGRDGSHPPGRRVDTLSGPEALKQLIALGYIAAPNQDQEKAREQTITELKFNLARSYLGGREYSQAAKLLTELFEAYPDQHRFGVQLAFCYRAWRKPAELKAVVQQIVERRLAQAKEAAAELEEWLALKPEVREPANLDRKERARLRMLRIKAHPSSFAIEYLRGCAEQALGNSEAALRHFEKARELDPVREGIWNQLAEVYLRQRRWSDAEECFRRELENDSENAQAHAGLSRCLIHRREYYPAIREALASVNLAYIYPYAHFLLGTALQRFGSAEDAVKAYQIALAQQPRFPAAHRGLSQIYARQLNNPEKAREHRRLAMEMIRARDSEPRATVMASRRPLATMPTEKPARADGEPDAEVITIVSGLPRSGTSLMMQMLSAGGLPPLTDSVRQPDEDNPLGYMEFEPAKNLHQDAEWLAQANGKCVKIVAQLLPFLPPGRAYRVILMERPIEEVLASQARMLDRNGRAGAAIDSLQLGDTFERQWRQSCEVLKERSIPFLVVSYRECLRDPAQVCEALAGFLKGAGLDAGRMRATVRPDLHRNHAALS